MSAGEKVVALPGFSVPTERGDPVKVVVDIMREYLAKAESGELRGVMIAAVLDQGTDSIDGDFAAAAGYAWALSVAIGRQTRIFTKWIDE